MDSRALAHDRSREPQQSQTRVGIADRGRGGHRLIVDAVALAAAAVAGAAARHGTAWAGAQALAILAGLAASGRYAWRRSDLSLDDTKRLVVVAAVVTTTAGILRLGLGEPGRPGDHEMALFALFVGCVAAGRLLVSALHAAHRQHAGRAATLVVGTGKVARTIASRLERELGPNLRPIGFLDDDPLDPGAAAGDPPGTHGLPVLGGLGDLERTVGAHGVECVVVAFSPASEPELAGLVERCWALGVETLVVPRLFELADGAGSLRRVGALPLQELRPAAAGAWPLRAKYAADRLVAALALAVLSPLLGAIALAIRLTMGSPILFRQERVGRGGRPFKMLKFRTMRPAAGPEGEADAAWAAMAVNREGAPAPEASSPSQVAARSTGLGSFLRRTSLDELPQLFNVLAGDMSLIGPRPERTHYVEIFEHVIAGYAERHRVKGGLTGWAQVNGLRGETCLSDRVEWDNYYIDHWRPLLDLWIVVRTVPALVRAAGLGRPRRSGRPQTPLQEPAAEALVADLPRSTAPAPAMAMTDAPAQEPVRTV